MNHDNNVSIIVNFIKFFSEKRIVRLAKEIGYKKRESKFEAPTFFKAFTFGVCHLSEISLKNIAQFCEDIQEGLTLTRQGLEAKLNKGSELMKLMYEESMVYRLSKEIENNRFNNILDIFNDVIIYDGTSFEVDEALAEYWPGYGGNNSKAGIKIQAVYSLKKKEFKKLDILGETSNDRTYTGNVVDVLKENDLAIGDLGFYNQKDFKGDRKSTRLNSSHH